MKKISLALSGGGARGIAHIGVIDVLKEHGFEIEEVAGTSMGALVGALYASGTLSEFRDWILEVDWKEIVKYLDFSLHEPGLIKGQKIMKKLSEFMPYEKIEDLPVRYKAIATDILHEEEVIWDKGDLALAVRSSISIPFVFTPVKKDDTWLVDGGVVNNLPLNRLENRLDNLCIGVWVNSPEGMDLLPENFHRKPEHTDKNKNKINAYLNKIIPHQTKRKSKHTEPGYYDILDASLHLIMSRNTQRLIRKYPPDVMVHVPRKLAHTFDFLSAKKLYEAGRFLGELKLKEYFKSA